MNIKQANGINELIGMYNDGEFEVENEARNITIPEEGHVFDENKSVKWNREEREALIKEKVIARQRYLEKRDEAYGNLWGQVDSLYANEFNLTKDQVTVVRVKAYRDRHSEGFISVIHEIGELLDMVAEMMEA